MSTYILVVIALRR